MYILFLRSYLFKLFLSLILLINCFEASIILNDIEYQKFNDLLKSKKEEIEFIENYIL